MSNKRPTPLYPGEFSPDYPLLSENDKDRLGFISVAKNLASSLLTQSTNHGLVVSVEGKWGSGKSSLVNLLVDELSKKHSDSVEVVRFEPWLVGSRDEMLMELMHDLSKGVETIERFNKTPEKSLQDEGVKLSKQLLGYGLRLSGGLAPFAKVAGIIGIPFAESAGKFLGEFKNMGEILNSYKTLPEIKEELQNRLYNLDKRIVVIIDDLDRLEPREAAEVMRLIRAVANFPNVIYILCFDQDILTESLNTALEIESGKEFLEKMIQVRFKVPIPESFALRRWLLDDCLNFYSLSKEKIAGELLERLREVIDIEGGILETPRNVVLVLNAIKLHWPPICNKADFGDLVWLQIIKIQNEALYLWIERYLNEYCAVSHGAVINEFENKNFEKDLKDITEDEENSLASIMPLWRLSKIIPSIKLSIGNEMGKQLFNFGNELGLPAFIDNCRLGSPYHSRLYFTFSESGSSLNDSDLFHFVSQAREGSSLDSLCDEYIKEKRMYKTTKFSVLIDRLKYLEDSSLPEDAIPSILMALADHMDEEAHISGSEGLMVILSWKEAMDLFWKLFNRLSRDQREKSMNEIFKKGKAIGWLMSEIVRNQINNSGLENETKFFLSKKELDCSTQLLLKRFKTLDRDKIIEVPDLLCLMYSWLESGDESGLKDWVEEQQVTDSGFLMLLKSCRGWSQSDKIYYPLNRRDMKNFLDFDQALERLNRIAEKDNSPEQRKLARVLLEAAKIGHDG